MIKGDSANGYMMPMIAQISKVENKLTEIFLRSNTSKYFSTILHTVPNWSKFSHTKKITPLANSTAWGREYSGKVSSHTIQYCMFKSELSYFTAT